MKQVKWPVWVTVIALTVALIFGAVFGTIVWVRASHAVLRYEGVYMSEGVYSYLCSFRKTQLLRSLSLSGVQVSDTKAFYAEEYRDGVTYGEFLSSYVDEYVRTLMVSAYMFDSITALSASEKRAVRAAVDALVDARAEGQRRAFNRQLEAYGCTYNDLVDAVTMQYKANRLFVLLYGNGADYISRDEAACRAYYKEAYVYADLLFIRTETRVLTDEYGEHTVVDLTPAERAERAADIARVDAAISALENGESGAMTEAMMEFFMDKYGDGVPEYDESGWYFSEDSRLYQDFSSDFPAIAEAVMTAPVGKYTKVESDIGACYIFRQPLPRDAYLDDSLSDFFTDFYFDCATSLHMDTLTKRAADVTATERLSTIDPVNIPKNTDYLVTVPQ